MTHMQHPLSQKPPSRRAVLRIATAVLAAAAFPIGGAAPAIGAAVAGETDVCLD